ncbi:MAG: transcriptional regulator, partial [Rikenellaceae bacterium]
ENIDHSIYFRDRVIDLPTYLARRDSDVIREFDSRYGTEFIDFPSLYSYRGYDAARIFGEGLFGDIEYGMMGESYTPLQSTYRFERGSENEMWINTHWMRVKYNINYTITID